MFLVGRTFTFPQFHYELNSWSDFVGFIDICSNTGKRLMAKCRLLYQENEELGRMIASGRIAKLEGELALQKSFSEEVKKSQSGESTKINIISITRYCSGKFNNFLSRLQFPPKKNISSFFINPRFLNIQCFY